jgi:hypothetical protein
MKKHERSYRKDHPGMLQLKHGRKEVVEVGDTEC